MEAPHVLDRLEIDSASIDADSSYGDEMYESETSHARTNLFRTNLLIPRSYLRSTYTKSLSASVLAYEWIYGRRYHSYGAGTYKFPNDEREQARLDLCHDIYYLLLGQQLFLAPINPDGMRILDIGTGIGKWPIQMGDLYPSAEVIGTDLSPIQPHLVPPNVRFIIDDVEQQWDDNQAYDYIHCRYIAGSIRDWPALMRQCYQHLKPGGWVELQESCIYPYSEDDSLKPGNKWVEMLELLAQACALIGRTMDPGPYLKRFVEGAGFDNVAQHVYKLPVGSWPKDGRMKVIGSFMAMHYIDGVEGLTLRPFTETLGWSRPDVEALNEQVRQAIRTRGVHAMHD
ncbi:hypothetical protein AJ80_02357 [Polytolypa hystricis UAMH7299]|uniref:Methyltransferase domain-containing protein n=1 Tax=Polytolypa hystricis (strain UAMH7299) TaxID=1447883 RepID=A0A2B7YSI4_POLH7|nr:hypothetical protein AJ80_02357 [Polytolypa hystricis UAMH7299]